MEEPGVYRATVTSKGQITIPADLRRALGLREGDRIEFAREERGTYTVRRAVDRAGIEAAIRAWQQAGPPLGKSGADYVEEIRGPLGSKGGARTDEDRRGHLLRD